MMDFLKLITVCLANTLISQATNSYQGYHSVSLSPQWDDQDHYNPTILSYRQHDMYKNYDRQDAMMLQ